MGAQKVKISICWQEMEESAGGSGTDDFTFFILFCFIQKVVYCLFCLFKKSTKQEKIYHWEKKKKNRPKCGPDACLNVPQGSTFFIQSRAAVCSEKSQFKKENRGDKLFKKECG